MSVTPLGSDAGDAGGSVGGIVDYLEGRGDEPALVQDGGGTNELGGYYADHASGRWIGDGVDGRGYNIGGDGHVEREHLERLLLGSDPTTGEQLMHSVGSSRRAGESTHSPTHFSESALLSAPQVAELAGVGENYIRKIGGQTAARLAEVSDPNAEARELTSSYLIGEKNEVGEWRFERDEVERFLEARKPQQVVHGYDITFSVSKSVSVLWAAADPETQQVIEDAITAGVDAGMRYLEDEGFWVRRGRGQEPAQGMAAAAYRHHTSRAMEPQLHDHVVVPNMAWGRDGRVQAVDARGLMAHATPAGHLADAVVRRELTNRLGVEWGPVDRGSAEIKGISTEALRSMSTRRQQLLALANEVGAHSTHGRQVAAVKSRDDKPDDVDPVELMEGWREKLADHGFGPEHVDQVLTNDGGRPGPFTDHDRAQLSDVLASAHGVTRDQAVFDRRDVLAAVADRAGGRLSVDEISTVTDEWLAGRAVPLEIANTWQSIGRHGRVGISRSTVYTTPEMVALEQRVLQRHRHGLNQNAGLVASALIEQAITKLEADLGARLGHDQAAAVRAICRSGHQFQAVQGLAGAGKTTAMRAAADAWTVQGYKMIALAPFGAAARKLGTELDQSGRTVESFLTRIETSGDPRSVIGPDHIVLVDEASTISNRQMDRLYRAVAETGATLRTIGDPHQHQAVEAKGLWNTIVDEHDATTPILDVNRRQNPETMAVVREALAEYREGGHAAAVDQLDTDQRIYTAESWPELLNNLVDDWFHVHSTAVAEGRRPSQIVAERNLDRHTLNALAQQRLAVAGLISKESRTIGETVFHIGDRVVAQAPNRDLKPLGAKRSDHVINGSTGIITGFNRTDESSDVTVEFDDLGTVTVPHDWVAAEQSAGRGGGIAPAYAVTSYKAEGQTYDVAFGLIDPTAADRSGTYVTLTRGRNDLRIYSINPEHTLARLESELRPKPDNRTITEALKSSLARPEAPHVASSADSGIAAALDALNPSDRAVSLTEAKVAAAAIAKPNPAVVATIGERPDRPGSHQHVWDQAAATTAIYQHRNPADSTLGPDGRPQALDNPLADRLDNWAATVDAIDRARQADLAMRPLDDLVSEFNQLRSTPEVIEQRLAINVEDAKTRYEVAELVADMSPTDQELFRRDVAHGRLQAAQADLAMFNQSGINGRQQHIENALTWRVNTATKQPSLYLIDAIGPRPSEASERSTWDRAAHLTERIRHYHGLTPQHGPQPGATPLQRAVGAANATWEPLTDAVSKVINLDPQRHNEIDR